jgi:predicted permease
MHAVVNAAIPIFALILIGFLSARFGGFDPRATDNLNRFAVYLALPALMFIAMSKITPEQLRLIIQPTITGILALYVFRMPPLWSHAALLLSALPIGSGPFTIAKLYGLEAGVTSGAILVSHLCLVVTVSILIAWLS